VVNLKLLPGFLFVFAMPAASGAEPQQPSKQAREVESAILIHSEAYQDKRTVAQILKDNVLIRAAAEGDVAAARRALQNGALVNSRYISEQLHPYSDNQYTALMRASRAGHAEVVQFLIESKADVNLKREGQSSLHMAVLAQHEPAVKLLLAAGATGDPKQIRLADQLIRAASRGASGQPADAEEGRSIQEVLRHGADFDATDPRGFTALMYAANLGLVENVKLLLASGADASLKSEFGDTALSMAERPGSYAPAERQQVARLLREAGKSPPAKPAAEPDPGDQSSRKYSKAWTDDYGNNHKEIYRAYTKLIKDGQGKEKFVEIWHGPATAFHKNGAKAWQGEFRHGQREGIFDFWSEEGVQTGRATYRQGMMHGMYTQWDRQGRKMREESYTVDQLHGETRWWDTEEKVLMVGTYRNSAPWTGTFAERNSPGEGWVARQYENGSRLSEEKIARNWWW
jgi:ankyrin repeat protein